MQSDKLPKLWREAHVTALLKSEKDIPDPKSFRPTLLRY